MYARKKGVNRKAVFAIVLVVALVVVTAAIVLYSNPGGTSKGTTVKVGVKAGDTFTYALSGLSTGPVPSTISSDFGVYNDTSYYKVTVTAVNGTKVTLDTDWAFRNGTNVETPQTIDLSSGILDDQNGFYALYPADMNANQTVYPHVYQGVWINGTQSMPYSTGARQQDYYTATSLLYYTQDPTHSTQCSTYDQIQFDRATGMLTSLVSIRDYNNPQMQTEIMWTLTSCSIWQV